MTQPESSVPAVRAWMDRHGVLYGCEPSKNILGVAWPLQPVNVVPHEAPAEPANPQGLKFVRMGNDRGDLAWGLGLDGVVYSHSRQGAWSKLHRVLWSEISRRETYSEVIPVPTEYAIEPVAKAADAKRYVDDGTHKSGDEKCPGCHGRGGWYDEGQWTTCSCTIESKAAPNVDPIAEPKASGISALEVAAWLNANKNRVGWEWPRLFAKCVYAFKDDAIILVGDKTEKPESTPIKPHEKVLWGRIHELCRNVEDYYGTGSRVNKWCRELLEAAPVAEPLGAVQKPGTKGGEAAEAAAPQSESETGEKQRPVGGVIGGRADRSVAPRHGSPVSDFSQPAPKPSEATTEIEPSTPIAGGTTTEVADEFMRKWQDELQNCNTAYRRIAELTEQLANANRKLVSVAQEERSMRQRAEAAEAVIAAMEEERT